MSSTIARRQLEQLSRSRSVPIRVGEGHAPWIRICHWVTAAAILTLAVTGYAMLMTNPRLYWGEVGNPLTPALFELPISRNYQHGGWEQAVPFFETPDSAISASRTYDILNLNAWGRSLHFLASWFLVAAGCVYLLAGLASGHVRRNLLPRGAELKPRALWKELVDHARLRIRATTGGPPYGLLQKIAYCSILFVIVPLMVLTGLTMSPAVIAAFPLLLDLSGGFQSARTIHFFLFVALLLFLVAHLSMVVLSGLGRQLRAMTLGQKNDG